MERETLLLSKYGERRRRIRGIDEGEV
jgi:hypothetical protein